MGIVDLENKSPDIKAVLFESKQFRDNPKFIDGQIGLSFIIDSDPGATKISMFHALDVRAMSRMEGDTVIKERETSLLVGHEL